MGSRSEALSIAAECAAFRPATPVGMERFELSASCSQSMRRGLHPAARWGDGLQLVRWAPVLAASCAQRCTGTHRTATRALHSALRRSRQTATDGAISPLPGKHIPGRQRQRDQVARPDDRLLGQRQPRRQPASVSKWPRYGVESGADRTPNQRVSDANVELAVGVWYLCRYSRGACHRTLC
jgi:hypothetical protein